MLCSRIILRIQYPDVQFSGGQFLSLAVQGGDFDGHHVFWLVGLQLQLDLEAVGVSLGGQELLGRDVRAFGGQDDLAVLYGEVADAVIAVGLEMKFL